MEDYQSQYTGPEIDAGIAKANTALQEVPANYRTAAAQDLLDVQAAARVAATYVPKTQYNPAEKSEKMIQPVGVDANGKLWTAGIYFAVCNTAGNEQYKDIYLPDVQEIVNGQSVRVAMVNAQSYNGTPWLRVHYNLVGSTYTGEASYKIRTTITDDAGANAWRAGQAIDLVCAISNGSGVLVIAGTANVDLSAYRTAEAQDVIDQAQSEDISDLKSAISQLGDISAFKAAILQLAQKVAYIDDQGQTYYDDLYDALHPPKTVTAVFEQGSTVIYDDTALNDLKQYLTVTAEYDDHTTVILEDNAYTLSGLLEAPVSTITVLYNGVSTTFSVAVTARPPLSSISAVYTQSGPVYTTDTLDSLTTDLEVTAHYSDSSTATVAAEDYTLSGTLTAGTSTITVSYGGKATIFSVTVTATDPREVVYEPGTWVIINIEGHRSDIYKKAVAARARSSAPVVNNNYTLTVTDSSKYNIAVYGITSLETESLPDGTGGRKTCYPGVDNTSVSWSASASRTTPYIAISLKKMDGTEFTSEELADGAVAVFTYT